MTTVRKELLMPSLAPSITSAKIARWHVAEGQAVSVGDILVEVATPTVTVEIEAENAGKIERILVPAGTDGVKADTPIAILLGAAHASHTSLSGRLTPLAFAGLPPALREVEAEAPSRVAAAAVAEKRGRDIGYREALRDALAGSMRADASVFVIGADVAQNRGAPRVTQGLVDAFGASRVVSVPAIDEATIGLAVGAAYAGLKPVVELPAWGRALDVVMPYLLTAAEAYYLSGGRLPVPIVFRGSNGFASGITGSESRCVASVLAQIPGLKVVQPATAKTAMALLSAAIDDPGPVVLLEDARLYCERGAMAGDAAWGLGVARVAREGRDVTLVAAGHAVLVALDAAVQLSHEGIDAEVVDLMSIRPLDLATVEASVQRTRRLVTIEDGGRTNGIGAEVVAAVVSGPSFAALKGAPLRIAAADVPMPYAAELQAAALPSVGSIVRQVAALLNGV